MDSTQESAGDGIVRVRVTAACGRIANAGV
jgi:hypothetical protein